MNDTPRMSSNQTISDVLLAREGLATGDDHVFIVIVNWNGWRDTVECLESVFRLTDVNYTVIVCDNASTDGSLGYISRWAAGDLAAVSRNEQMSIFSSPSVPKPLTQAMTHVGQRSLCLDTDTNLILMQNETNLGFAGASNIGISIALAHPDVTYIWLLNNDTVVRRDALSSLIDRMKEDPEAGICGSTLLFYDDPQHIQACGGSRYNPWTSRGGHIAAGKEAVPLPDREWVQQRLGYIVGASMLVSRSFVETVGLMSERYFLYFEEVDWATRGRGKFSLVYAPSSVVYHKVGATIGSAAHSLYQSELADFWGTRNRLAFTRLHYWYALPSVYLFVLASAMLRFVHGRIKNALAVLSGAFRISIPQQWDVAGSSRRREQTGEPNQNRTRPLQRR